MSILKERAHDLFTRVADKIGVPDASEYSSAAKADEILEPTLRLIQIEFQSACRIHGLHVGEAWDLTMPRYMRAKGWTVEDINGDWAIVTRDVEK
jgi:hypothetical protein